MLDAREDEAKVSIASTHKCYEKAFPSNPIGVAFKSFSDDPWRVRLSKLRNVLTHRASPPRAFRLTVGEQRHPKPSAEITRVDLALSENTTVSFRREVARLLQECLLAAEAFVACEL